MKNSFNKIGLVVGLCATLCVTANATLTTLPIGGNDNATLQQFNVTNTLIAGANITPTNGLGGYVDISAFNEVTLFMVCTNASTTVSTNKFSLNRALDNSGLTTETTPYATFTVPIPAQSYMVWQTNLVAPDVAGQGFLTLSALTNTAPSGTNGSGGLAVYGTTNNFPLQIGVMYKIKHSLR